MNRPKPKFHHCLIILLLLSSTPSFATDMKEIHDALRQRDYQTALDLLKQLAENGNAEAQYELGVTFRNGRLLPRDTGQAAAWFEKAAEQDHADAQYALGLYLSSQDTRENQVKSQWWFQRAADQG
ncbi:MAG: tetratricopeptide repeat protein, partial [Sedimenticola sp.]